MLYALLLRCLCAFRPDGRYSSPSLSSSSSVSEGDDQCSDSESSLCKNSANSSSSVSSVDESSDSPFRFLCRPFLLPGTNSLSEFLRCLFFCVKIGQKLNKIKRDKICNEEYVNHSDFFIYSPSFLSFCFALPFSSSFPLVLYVLLLFLPLSSFVVPLRAPAFSFFCKVPIFLYNE